MPTDWAEFTNFRQQWQRYAKWDEVLSNLCQEHRSHANREAIYAKVYLVGRSYQSGIERVAIAGRHGTGMDEVAERLLKCGSRVDDWIRTLQPLGSEPARDNLLPVCRAHQGLMDILADVTRKSPRSFVSKYLHFHAPVVPIYDSYASSVVSRRDWRPWTGISPREAPPKRVDESYWKFCTRILRMAESWRAEGLQPTARNLDIYLLRWHAKHAMG